MIPPIDAATVVTMHAWTARKFIPRALPPLKPNLRGGRVCGTGRVSQHRFSGRFGKVRRRPGRSSTVNAPGAREQVSCTAETSSVVDGREGKRCLPSEPEQDPAERDSLVSEPAQPQKEHKFRRTFRGQRARQSEDGRRAWRCRSRGGDRGRRRGQSRPCPVDGSGQYAPRLCASTETHRGDVHGSATGEVEVACRREASGRNARRSPALRRLTRTHQG